MRRVFALLPCHRDRQFEPICWQPSFLAFVFASVGSALCGGDAQAAGWSLRAEMGAEHDTNPGRVERVANEEKLPRDPSLAGRGLLSADMQARLATRTFLSLSSKGAARGYAADAARDESLLVLQGTAALVQGIGNTTRLLAATGYYEAFQQDGLGARDFRSLSPSFSLLQDVGKSRWSLGGGYRDFRFKPSAQLNFHGPTAALSYRRSWGPSMEEEPEDEDAADWDLLTSFTFERRSFGSPRCLEAAGCSSTAMNGSRTDDFSAVAVDVSRTGGFLMGAGAAFQLNASNSFGDGLWRALAHVDATFLLPWQLSLSGRGELVWTRYFDEVPISRDAVSGLPVASIEDESRSTVRLEILRPVTRHVDVSARWIAYTNEIGGGTAQYRRQTFLLQVGLSL